MATALLWCKPCPSARLYYIHNNITNAKRQQHYADKIARLHNVRPSILFVSFAAHIGGRETNTFYYSSHMARYWPALRCQQQDTLFNISFPQLEHLQLCLDDGRHTHCASYFGALSALLHGCLVTLKCSVSASGLVCL